MFGYTAEEAIGQSIRMIIPADRQGEEDDVLARDPRRAGGRPLRDHSRQRKDGRLVPVSLSVSPIFDDAGTVIGASKIARDISDRQAADLAAQRLAAVVESSDDAIVSKDLDGVITSWNAAAQRMFGYTPEEAIGRSVRMLIPADRQAEEDEVLARIRRGEPVDHFETVRQRRDGSTLAISLTVSPIKDDQGRVIGASKVARDISLRAQLAQDAAQASRMKDEFLAVLSHELRTPLHAIIGYARADAHGRPGRVEADGCRRSHRAQLQAPRPADRRRPRRLAHRGRQDPARHPAARAAAGDHNAVSTVQPAADAKGVRIEIVIDPRAGLVSGDPARLQQVVWNLLTNAVKFTPKGGRVQVRLERVHSHVEVVVSDTGVGIAPEFLPHVFDQFSQADTGLTRRTGGLGLGLSIVRHLVEMHGGTVEVASPGTGLGSTFRVCLPTRIAHQSRRAGPPARHPTAALAGRPIPVLTGLSGVRVLAVDDEAEARQVLRAILESAGAEVDTVSSGAEVLERLTAHRPDVLIADVGMPGMDGFDLIEQVRAFDDAGVRDVPAAALTAYARPRTARARSTAGSRCTWPSRSTPRSWWRRWRRWPAAGGDRRRWCRSWSVDHSLSQLADQLIERLGGSLSQEQRSGDDSHQHHCRRQHHDDTKPLERPGEYDHTRQADGREDDEQRRGGAREPSIISCNAIGISDHVEIMNTVPAAAASPTPIRLFSRGRRASNIRAASPLDTQSVGIKASARRPLCRSHAANIWEGVCHVLSPLPPTASRTPSRRRLRLVPARRAGGTETTSSRRRAGRQPSDPIGDQDGHDDSGPDADDGELSRQHRHRKDDRRDVQHRYAEDESEHEVRRRSLTHERRRHRRRATRTKRLRQRTQGASQ